MINFSLEAYRVHANNWGERCSHQYLEISPCLIQTTFQEFFCVFIVCLVCTLLYVHVGGVVVSRCWNQSWVLWRTASTLSHCSIAPAPYGYIFCSCRPVYASSVLAPHLFWGGVPRTRFHWLCKFGTYLEKGNTMPSSSVLPCPLLFHTEGRC